MKELLNYFRKGFTIDFVSNPALQKGKGVLMLHPDDLKELKGKYEEKEVSNEKT